MRSRPTASKFQGTASGTVSHNALVPATGCIEEACGPIVKLAQFSAHFLFLVHLSPVMAAVVPQVCSKAPCLRKRMLVPAAPRYQKRMERNRPILHRVPSLPNDQHQCNACRGPETFQTEMQTAHERAACALLHVHVHRAIYRPVIRLGP
jgi:hypothetical protein